MKKQYEDAYEWIKEQDKIKGCITGSYMLGYFEGEKQDIDVFLFDEKSFQKLIYAMHYSPKFQILDKLEAWKFNQYITEGEKSFYKFGLITLKFTWNLCVPINVVLKKNCNNTFSVLSSFDMDLVTRGFDLGTKQYLDLSGDSAVTKVVSWNKGNTSFIEDTNIWSISRLLRQFQRVIKYHKRGYNTDLITIKYGELLDKLLDYTSIFNSENFDEKLVIMKENAKILKQILEIWLKEHSLTGKELELLELKIKEL